MLVEIGLTEDKLSLSSEQRNDVLDAWSKVDEHDKQPQQFNQLYRTHWGNTLYCPTKRDDLVDAALVHLWTYGNRNIIRTSMILNTINKQININTTLK